MSVYLEDEIDKKNAFILEVAFSAGSQSQRNKQKIIVCQPAGWLTDERLPCAPLTKP